MFSLNGKTLAQANLQDESVRKLKRLPEEYSSFLDVKDQRSDLNRSGIAPQIGHLRFKLSGVSFKARVVREAEVSAVTSRDGNSFLVCDATLSEGTGEIQLGVWNSQIATVSLGDITQIHNARARSYRGQLQLYLGRKTGILTILEHATYD